MARVILFTWVNLSRFDGPDVFFQNFLMVSLNALIFFGYAYLTAYLLIPVFLIRKNSWFLHSFLSLLDSVCRCLSLHSQIFFFTVPSHRRTLPSLNFPLILSSRSREQREQLDECMKSIRPADPAGEAGFEGKSLDPVEKVLSGK